MNRVFMISVFVCMMVYKANAQDANSSTAAQPPSLKAYDNYDFVPGEKTIFADGFSDPQRRVSRALAPGLWTGVIAEFDGKKVFALTEGENGDRAVVIEPGMKKCLVICRQVYC